MNFLLDTMNCLGAVLLPVVAALLFEELTFGGLVRLLLVRRSHPSKLKNHTRHLRGETKCSH
jgi:hypothetical protein